MTRNTHPCHWIWMPEWRMAFFLLLKQFDVWFLDRFFFAAADSGCQNRRWVCSGENPRSSQHSIIRGIVDLCYARWWFLKEFQKTIQYLLAYISGWVCFFSSREEVYRDIWDQQAWHGRPYHNFLQGYCGQNIPLCILLFQVGGRAAKMRDKLAQMGYTGVQVFHPPMLHSSHCALIIFCENQKS